MTGLALDRPAELPRRVEQHLAKAPWEMSANRHFVSNKNNT